MKPLKSKTITANHIKKSNEKSFPNSECEEPTPATLQELADEIVAYFALNPIPPDFDLRIIPYHGFVVNTEIHTGDGDLQPIESMTKIKAFQCDGSVLGSFLVADYEEDAYISVDDLARITDLKREQIHDFIEADAFALLRPSDGGDNVDFIQWPSGALLCIPSSKGQGRFQIVSE